MQQQNNRRPNLQLLLSFLHCPSFLKQSKQSGELVSWNIVTQFFFRQPPEPGMRSFPSLLVRHVAWLQRFVCDSSLIALILSSVLGFLFHSLRHLVQPWNQTTSRLLHTLPSFILASALWMGEAASDVISALNFSCLSVSFLVPGRSASLLSTQGAICAATRKIRSIRKSDDGLCGAFFVEFTSYRYHIKEQHLIIFVLIILIIFIFILIIIIICIFWQI